MPPRFAILLSERIATNRFWQKRLMKAWIPFAFAALVFAVHWLCFLLVPEFSVELLFVGYMALPFGLANWLFPERLEKSPLKTLNNVQTTAVIALYFGSIFLMTDMHLKYFYGVHFWE
jgi:hypothetical protein